MNAGHHDYAHRCADILEPLSRYLDDDLPGAERQAIEKHLADCPCCEEVLGSMEDTLSLCHEKGRTPLPPAVRARARARVQELLADAGPDSRPGTRSPAPRRRAGGRS